MKIKGRNPNIVYQREFFTVKTDSQGIVANVGKIQDYCEIVRLQKASEKTNKFFN
jgi:hypothetical protein